MVAEHFEFNPYPGLRSFTEKDSHLFFGREKQVDVLLTKLQRNRFVSVSGTSGCGKTSLLRAGLTPALMSGFMAKHGSNWQVSTCRTEDDPVLSLAKALCSDKILDIKQKQDIYIQREVVRNELMRDESSFVDIVRKSKLQENDNLLIIVDQFEEIFRYKNLGAEQKQLAGAFVKSILYAVNQTEVAIYVVLAFRSDFIGHCSEFDNLIQQINKSHYIIPKMNDEELEKAILGPALITNTTFSSSLLTRFLNDINKDTEELPILQHALMCTWNYWYGKRSSGEKEIDILHYEAVGGMNSALSIHAEETYKSLRPEQQKIATSMFKTITERVGDLNVGVRRPSKISEICRIAEISYEEIVPVIEAFAKVGRSFITILKYESTEVNTESVVDISHESIMKIWGSLKNWVYEEALSAESYLRLVNSAKMHQAGKQSLIEDPELNIALRWYEHQKPTKGWALRYDPAFELTMSFLDQSKKEKERKMLLDEKQQKKKLKRTRNIALSLGLFSLVSILLLIFAIISRVESEKNAEQARLEKEKAIRDRMEALKQKQRATLSEYEALKQKENAILSQEEAIKQQELAEENAVVANTQKILAQTSVREAQKQQVIAEQKTREAEKQREIADIEKQSALKQKKIAEIAKRKADTLRILALARSLAVSSTKMFKEENYTIKGLLAVQAYTLYQGYAEEKVFNGVYEALLSSYSALTNNKKYELSGHNHEIRALQVYDNNMLASGSIDGKLLIWKYGQGGTFKQFKNIDTCQGENICGVRALCFYPSSSQIITGHQNGSIKIWDYQKGKLVYEAKETDSPVISVTASNLSSLVTYSYAYKKKVYIRNIRSWSYKKVINFEEENIYQIRFNHKNQIFVAANNNLYLTDIYQEKKDLVYQAKNDILALELIGNNKILIGDRVGKVEALSLTQSGQAKVIYSKNYHKSSVTNLAYNATKQLAASVSMDSKVKLFYLNQANKTPIELSKTSKWLFEIEFSKDGEYVFFAGKDNVIYRFPTSNTLLASEVCKNLKRNITQQEWNNYIGNAVVKENPCQSIYLSNTRDQ